MSKQSLIFRLLGLLALLTLFCRWVRGVAARAENLVSLSAGSSIITADTTHTRPISPWIYGINAYEGISNAPRHLTLNRTGGNRWTAYNWENNFSNAGSDWGPYIYDDSLSKSSVPAEAVRSIIQADRARSNASLITVQLQDYVSADKGGNVDPSDPNHLADDEGQLLKLEYRQQGTGT